MKRYVANIILGFVEIRYSFIVICFIATVAALQEGCYIKKGMEV